MGKHTSVSDMQLLLNSRSFHHLKDTISSLEQLPLLKHLQLTFLMSNTPKKGNWPATFADSLETQQVESISVQSPAMPASTLMVSAGQEHKVCMHRVFGGGGGGGELLPPGHRQTGAVLGEVILP
jgi:hypothetical protein